MAIRSGPKIWWPAALQIGASWTPELLKSIHSAGNMGRAQLGQPEHGPKTGAQNTAQHEIIRAGLARPEERAGPCLESRPVVPPTRPARAGRAWAGPARNGPSKSPRGRIEDPVADADSSNLAAAFIPHRETRPVAPSCSGAEP